MDISTTVESNTELILMDQSSESSTDSNVKKKELNYGETTLCVNDHDHFFYSSTTTSHTSHMANVYSTTSTRCLCMNVPRMVSTRPGV